jgi:hypothetical protein
MAKKKEENLMSAYVAAEEGQVTPSPFTDAKVEVVQEPGEDSNPAYIPPQAQQPQPQRTMAEIARENRTHGREGMPFTGNGSGLKYRDNIGWLKLDTKSLPTQGLFYPEGFEISIRAARGEEIKHWSTMNDQDINQLSRVDDILNYMIEKCCNVKNPEKPGNCWKDLKNVDRFYILLAIKEFTFLDGENELMVPVSEDKQIPVVKEMIDFIHIPEDVMKFYNSDEKCFIFNISGNVIKMYIPSLGVNEWLKRYVAGKINAKEGYDEDFITYAPMLINDYRNLSQRAYEEMVAASRLWGYKEWSVLSHVTTALGGSTEPKFKYMDENGSEVEIPLTFRGGIRSIFVISNPLSSIC